MFLLNEWSLNRKETVGDICFQQWLGLKFEQLMLLEKHSNGLHFELDWTSTSHNTQSGLVDSVVGVWFLGKVFLADSHPAPLKREYMGCKTHWPAVGNYLFVTKMSWIPSDDVDQEIGELEEAMESALSSFAAWVLSEAIVWPLDWWLIITMELPRLGMYKIRDSLIHAMPCFLWLGNFMKWL